MPDRRKFMQSGVAGLLSYTLLGQPIMLSPAQAKQSSADLNILTSMEVSIIEAIADSVLPNAVNSGIAWYIDHQLSQPNERCLLTARHLGIAHPFIDFYRPCLQSINELSQHLYEKEITNISKKQIENIVKLISSEQPKLWKGAPAPFFSFVFRSDVIDVVYGTQQGFQTLNIPYLGHINPKQKW